MSTKARLLFALVAILILGHFIYSRVHQGGTEALHGETDLRYKTFGGDLNISGPTTFFDIKVEGATKISGPVSDSKNGTFNSLDLEGPADMESVKATKLIAAGPLNCSKCTLGEANISGPATLDESTAETLTVTGPLSGDGLTVTAQTKVTGPVTVKNSNFDKLEFNSTEATFEDSKIKEMVIMPDGENRKQVVTLSGDTTVEEDIIFKSGNGEVVMHGGNVKIKGIVGGTHKAKTEAAEAVKETAPEQPN